MALLKRNKDKHKDKQAQQRQHRQNSRWSIFSSQSRAKSKSTIEHSPLLGVVDEDEDDADDHRDEEKGLYQDQDKDRDRDRDGDGDGEQSMQSVSAIGENAGTGIVVVEDLLANWMAPEVIHTRRFQQASDIFSLGTVLWEIVSKQLPFEHYTQPEIRRLLMTGQYHYKPGPGQNGPIGPLQIPEAEKGTVLGDIIHACWAADPSLRPTAEDIVRLLERAIEDYPLQYLKYLSAVDSIPDCESVREYYLRFYRDTFPVHSPLLSLSRSAAAMSVGGGGGGGGLGSLSLSAATAHHLHAAIDLESMLYDSFYAQTHHTRRWASGYYGHRSAGKKGRYRVNGQSAGWLEWMNPWTWLFGSGKDARERDRKRGGGGGQQGGVRRLSHDFHEDPRFGVNTDHSSPSLADDSSLYDDPEDIDLEREIARDRDRERDPQQIVVNPVVMTLSTNSAVFLANQSRSRIQSNDSDLSSIPSEFSDFVNDSDRNGYGGGGAMIDEEDRLAMNHSRFHTHSGHTAHTVNTLSMRIKLQAQMPKSAHDAIRLVKVSLRVIGDSLLYC
jgi:hypothetical protein